MNDQLAQRDGVRRKLKKNRRRQLFTRLGIAAGVVIIFITLALVFQIRTIEVTGNHFLTEQEVKNYVETQIRTDNSLFLLVRTWIGNCPVPATVKNVKFSMKTPWTVVVNVVEKTAVGYVESDGRYVYFDEDGYVLGITDSLTEDVFRIEGLDVKEAEKGKKLSVQDDSVFRYLVSASELLKQKNLEAERIVCDGENITLYFDNICVELGSGNPEEKIRQLPSVLPSLKGQNGTLHLEHFGESTNTISFEKK